MLKQTNLSFVYVYVFELRKSEQLEKFSKCLRVGEILVYIIRKEGQSIQYEDPTIMLSDVYPSLSRALSLYFSPPIVYICKLGDEREGRRELLYPLSLCMCNLCLRGAHRVCTKLTLCKKFSTGRSERDREIERVGRGEMEGWLFVSSLEIALHRRFVYVVKRKFF